MSTRKRRETIDPWTGSVGPIWLVRGGGHEEYVQAASLDEAVEVFILAVGALTSPASLTRLGITYATRIAVTVHTMPDPPDTGSGADGDGESS